MYMPGIHFLKGSWN